MLPLTTVAMATFTHPRVSRGTTRVSTIGIGSLATVMRAGKTRGVPSTRDAMMGPAIVPTPLAIGSAIGAGRGRTIVIAVSSGRSTLSSVRRVPRFPNNARTLGRCLSGGVGCPTRTGRGNARKHIVMRFMMSRGKGIASPGVTHDMSPSLSTRTLQLVRGVPR